LCLRLALHFGKVCVEQRLIDGLHRKASAFPRNESHEGSPAAQRCLRASILRRSVTADAKKSLDGECAVSSFHGAVLTRNDSLRRPGRPGKCVAATSGMCLCGMRINHLLTIRELDLSNEKLT